MPTAHASGNEYRYWGLLGSLILMMLIAPVIEPQGSIWLLMQAVFAVLLVFAVWIVSHNTRTTVIASVLSLAVFAGSSLERFTEPALAVELATLVVGSAFFAYVCAIVLRDVFVSRRVSVNTIVGAICGYLLLGVFWGFLYGIVDLVEPGSFPVAVVQGDFVARFVYFSMVTLTTLGYGDITPLSAAARGLAIVEATVGQIYLTVLVARLVGLHLSQNDSGM